MRVLLPRILLLSFAMLVLSACSTVEIHNADVHETRQYGLVVLKVEPKGSGAVLVITNGVGVTLGTSTLTLGYLAETAVFAGDLSACRAFIVVSDASQLQALAGLLKEQPQLQQLCIAKKGP